MSTGRTIGSLPDFRLETWFSQWEFASAHSFTASDAETLSVGELLSLSGLSIDTLTSLDLGYRPTYGSDHLRAAVAATYDVVQAPDVLTFAGAQEALFWVLSAVLRDGGHAVVTVPNYQSLETIPQHSDASVSGLPLWSGSGADVRWTLDLDRLEALLRPDTRLVAVNFPNNPTGFVPDRDTYRRLAQMCHVRGIVLVADEVYRGIEVDSAMTLPHAADLSPTAVSVNVMSKSYGLPGLRVGWVATQDRALISRLERLKHYTSICNPGVTEHLAVAALGIGNQIHDRNRAIVAANISAVRDFCADYPDLLAFEAPMGGCVSFPRFLGQEGSDTFARRTVEEAGILTLPSSIYRSNLGDVPSDRLRIGFGRTSLPTTIAALREYLEISRHAT
jgi:aspartate/methionine/tyrosine aminotransferase